MKRIVCLIAALICLIAGPALAETVDERVDALPLDSLQALADEADSGLDLRGLVRRLAAENGPGDGAQVLEEMKNLLLSALREAFPSLLTLSAPAEIRCIPGRSGASETPCSVTRRAPACASAST